MSSLLLLQKAQQSALEGHVARPGVEVESKADAFLALLDEPEEAVSYTKEASVVAVDDKDLAVPELLPVSVPKVVFWKKLGGDITIISTKAQVLWLAKVWHPLVSWWRKVWVAWVERKPGRDEFKAAVSDNFTTGLKAIWAGIRWVISGVFGGALNFVKLRVVEFKHKLPSRLYRLEDWFRDLYYDSFGKVAIICIVVAIGLLVFLNWGSIKGLFN